MWERRGGGEGSSGEKDWEERGERSDLFVALVVRRERR